MKTEIALKTEARDAYLAANAATLAAELLHDIARAFSAEQTCGVAQEVAANAEGLTAVVEQILAEHPASLTEEMLTAAMALLDIVNRVAGAERLADVECGAGGSGANPLWLGLGDAERKVIEGVLAIGNASADAERGYLARARELQQEIDAAQDQIDLAKAQMPVFAADL